MAASARFDLARSFRIDNGMQPTERQNASRGFPRDDELSVAGLIAPEVVDFVPLKPNQPLLLGLDGAVVKTHDERALTPFFVNEAAYYEKGVAFVLAETAGVGVEVVL